MQESLKPKRPMVRKQVFITTEQNTRLKSLAAATGDAEGQLVRRGLDLLLEREAARTVDWKAGLMELRGMWADRYDLDTFYAQRREARRSRRQRMNKQIRQRGAD